MALTETAWREYQQGSKLKGETWKSCCMSASERVKGILPKGDKAVSVKKGRDGVGSWKLKKKFYVHCSSLLISHFLISICVSVSLFLGHLG